MIGINIRQEIIGGVKYDPRGAPGKNCLLQLQWHKNITVFYFSFFYNVDRITLKINTLATTLATT